MKPDQSLFTKSVVLLELMGGNESFQISYYYRQSHAGKLAGLQICIPQENNRNSTYNYVSQQTDFLQLARSVRG